MESVSACSRYFQRYSLGGSSDAAFLCQYCSNFNCSFVHVTNGVVWVLLPWRRCDTFSISGFVRAAGRLGGVLQRLSDVECLFREHGVDMGRMRTAVDRRSVLLAVSVAT